MISRILYSITLATLFVFVLGCATPAERAEKLYSEGKYEEVLERYPQEPAAAKAKEALATKLLKDGEYERVMKEFANTPMANEARVRFAEQLMKDGKFEEVLDRYSDTPAAIKAREQAAQALYDAGKVSEAARDYPQTPAGSAAREELARAEYSRIMTFRSPAERRKALEEFISTSLYAGTGSAVEAQMELAKLDGLKIPGNY
jgi:tetratricopeptide (TPR) repeat protein